VTSSKEEWNYSQRLGYCDHGTVKLCYADETGTDGQSQLVVMVGIVADSQRLHRTQTDFADTFAKLGEATVKELRELKSVDLYRGHGP
jgi:hypothetical protein